MYRNTETNITLSKEDWIAILKEDLDNYSHVTPEQRFKAMIMTGTLVKV